MTEDTPREVTEAQKIGLSDGQFIVERSDGSREAGWNIDSILQRPDPDDPSRQVGFAFIVKPVAGLDPDKFPAKLVKTEKLLSWQPQLAEGINDDTVPTELLSARGRDSGGYEASVGLQDTESRQSQEAGRVFGEGESELSDSQMAYGDRNLAEKLMRQEIPVSEEHQATVTVLTRDARVLFPHQEARTQLGLIQEGIGQVLGELDPNATTCHAEASRSHNRVKQLTEMLQDTVRVFEADSYNTERARASDLIDRIEQAIAEARTAPAVDTDIGAIKGKINQLSGVNEAAQDIERSAYALRDDPEELGNISIEDLDETQRQLLLDKAPSLEQGRTQQMADEIIDAQGRALVAKFATDEVKEEALRLVSAVRNLSEGAVVDQSLRAVDRLIEGVRAADFSRQALGSFIAELRSHLSQLEKVEEDLGVISLRSRSVQEFIKKLHEASEGIYKAEIFAGESV